MDLVQLELKLVPKMRLCARACQKQGVCNSLETFFGGSLKEYIIYLDFPVFSVLQPIQPVTSAISQHLASQPIIHLPSSLTSRAPQHSSRNYIGYGGPQLDSSPPLIQVFTRGEGRKWGNEIGGSMLD